MIATRTDNTYTINLKINLFYIIMYYNINAYVFIVSWIIIYYTASAARGEMRSISEFGRVMFCGNNKIYNNNNILYYIITHAWSARLCPKNAQTHYRGRAENAVGIHFLRLSQVVKSNAIRRFIYIYTTHGNSVLASRIILCYYVTRII